MNLIVVITILFIMLSTATLLFGLAPVLLVCGFVISLLLGMLILIAASFTKDKKRAIRLKVYAAVIIVCIMSATVYGVVVLSEESSLRDGQVARHRAHNSDTAGSNPAPANAVSLFDNEH